VWRVVCELAAAASCDAPMPLAAEPARLPLLAARPAPAEPAAAPSGRACVSWRLTLLAGRAC
jgi:hypothetical protein